MYFYLPFHSCVVLSDSLCSAKFKKNNQTKTVRQTTGQNHKAPSGRRCILCITKYKNAEGTEAIRLFSPSFMYILLLKWLYHHSPSPPNKAGTLLMLHCFLQYSWGMYLFFTLPHQDKITWPVQTSDKGNTTSTPCLTSYLVPQKITTITYM